MHYSSRMKEGLLITFLGLLGIFRVIYSFPDAGEMITLMLYTLLFIFVAITIIGIIDIKESFRKTKTYIGRLKKKL